MALLITDRMDLDDQLTAMDIVIKGEELCLDWMDVCGYMLEKGFSKHCINTCMRIVSGKDLKYA